MRDRCEAKGLMTVSGASLSLRIPGTDAMLFGAMTDVDPRRLPWKGGAASSRGLGLHVAVYAVRDDVGAIAIGGGAFGRRLADFGGAMPGVFDEQVRHLGQMGPAVEDHRALASSLRCGGNTVLLGGEPICLGTTPSRLVLNAELFEKCAKAYVLAVATGGRVKALPWIVRTVANRRLMKDEQRAKARFAEGLLPEEARGY